MRTIAAAATPLVKGGAVGIVRMSGDKALETAKKIFSSSALNWDNIESGRMYLGEIDGGNFKDKAFCVYHKAPKSYTGEDIVEFQTHGGVSIMKSLLRLLYKMDISPAAPGEFTKRAYLNGKMTLGEAEGVCDIINAESEAAAMQAYRLLSGGLSKEISVSAELLLSASANLEAVLDYPEELSDDMRAPTLKLLEEAEEVLRKMLDASKKRRYVTEGVSVVIAGLTNVGKSSLMNAILKDDRAIVTDVAGTTRDVIRETLEIDGIKINLTDTAGIRESGDRIEEIGIKRAEKAVESADLILFLTDLSALETEDERKLRARINGKKAIIVGNKGDIALRDGGADIIIEAKNGVNIDGLVKLMAEKLEITGAANSVILTRDRHIYLAEKAYGHVKDALSAYGTASADCLLVDIKEAYRALSDITGADAEESIVDKIFKEFCVGK